MLEVPVQGPRSRHPIVGITLPVVLGRQGGLIVAVLVGCHDGSCSGLEKRRQGVRNQRHALIGAVDLALALLQGVSVIQSVPDFSRFSSSIETHTRHSLC